LDLRAVVQGAVDMSSAAFDRRQHTLDVTLGLEPVCVSADRTRMKQVFSNLLQNAASYTPQGGQVSVSVGQQDGQAIFRLRDNGIGIPPEALRRIFELFDRGSQHPEVAGAGIGLAVVRRLVELHGGTVAANSDGAGQGSEFVVVLQSVLSDSVPRAD
jgi:signal transduction histidine kinase